MSSLVATSTITRGRLAASALVAAAVLPLAARAQSPASRPALTAADYDRATRFLSWNVNPLVSGVTSQRVWNPDGTLTYRLGQRTIVVDPSRRTHVVIDSTGRVPNPAGRRAAAAETTVSPDGRYRVFIRDWNLWAHDNQANRDIQLTTDGVKDFGYATDNAGWVHSDNAIVAWSPDSKRIATFQQDQRNVRDFYLIDYSVNGPTLSTWKYPFVGDSVVSMIQRVVIDLSGPAPRVVRLQMPPDQHRSTICDHISCSGEFTDVEWSPDGGQLAFASSSRDHKDVWLRVADPSTGAVRTVLHEASPTWFESGMDAVNWRFLPQSSQLLWWSQRDDWGNLYLYDLKTGQLQKQLTRGPGNVAEVVRVDPASRTLWFVGVGREAGRDPYFRHLYRLSMDGSSAPTLLTPENANHDISFSSNGRYFVDSYSTPDTPPTVVLRDARSGALVMTLEKADISRLRATGWTPPIPFTVKSRDGKYDLYGLMYRPSNFDSTKSYPIINHVYPGPQTGSVGTRSFVAARGDSRALAELGFIVVEIDATGSPFRSKSFHAAYANNMGDNGLPDQVAGMRELARRYSWIDTTRAGIWGHSGGGYATADAMFRYPDFFKVGISESGNHDNRLYEDDWAEKWSGLLTRGPNGTSNYDDQANQNHVAGLKGKLLLAHGTADDNVPPDNTMVLVDALIRANKDFDLILLPNQRHGYGPDSNYMMRRRWDYFVRNLMGAEPPANYEITMPQRAVSR